MKTVKVPLGSPVYTNVDEVELKDFSQKMVNCFLDEAGAVVKRPGYELTLNPTDYVGTFDYNRDAYTGAGSDGAAPINDGIRHLYWWPYTSRLAVWTPTEMLLLYRDGATYDTIRHRTNYTTNSTMTSDAPFSSPYRVSAVGNGTNLFYSNGVNCFYDTFLYSGSTKIGDFRFFQFLNATSPSNWFDSSHVAFLDGYIIANDLNSQIFRFSDSDGSLPSAGGYISWNANDFAQAVGRPDLLTALHVFRRELFLFGTHSVEIWQNDGTNPFSRIDGGFIDTGCIAPYSIVNTDTGIYWLNQNKRFVRYVDGNLEYVSEDYDKEIQKLSVVSDCWSFRLELAGKELIIFQFPAESRTLCLNTDNDSWSEWGEYTSAGNYKVMPFTAFEYIPDWSLRLVGTQASSDLYNLSSEVYTDNGSPIRFSQTSGHINFGTTKNKRSHELRLIMKRGTDNSPVTGGKMMLRYKDNGSNTWSNEIEIDLGEIGETEHVVRLKPRGIYRTRQYEIYSDSPIPVLHIDAEEDIEVLAR